MMHLHVVVSFQCYCVMTASTAITLHQIFHVSILGLTGFKRGASGKLVILQLNIIWGRSALLKILVAEDEPEILRLYKLLLEEKGYQVITTIDGKECLDSFKKELTKTGSNQLPPFDLVILDYRMPRMTGVEVAKEILRVCPDQRLLMVTVYAGHLDLQDDILKNKMQVIQKPFDVDELLNTVSLIVNH